MTGFSVVSGLAVVVVVVVVVAVVVVDSLVVVAPPGGYSYGGSVLTRSASVHCKFIEIEFQRY